MTQSTGRAYRGRSDHPSRIATLRRPCIVSSHPNQLSVPDEPLRDAQAQELARVWSAQGHQFFALDVSSEADPAAWGLFAMDLMKHAARAYEHLDGRPRAEAYKRILTGFMLEMQNPSEPL